MLSNIDLLLFHFVGHLSGGEKKSLGEENCNFIFKEWFHVIRMATTETKFSAACSTVTAVQYNSSFRWGQSSSAPARFKRALLR